MLKSRDYGNWGHVIRTIHKCEVLKTVHKAYEKQKISNHTLLLMEP